MIPRVEEEGELAELCPQRLAICAVEAEVLRGRRLSRRCWLGAGSAPFPERPGLVLLLGSLVLLGEAALLVEETTLLVDVALLVGAVLLVGAALWAVAVLLAALAIFMGEARM